MPKPPVKKLTQEELNAQAAAHAAASRAHDAVVRAAKIKAAAAAARKAEKVANGTAPPPKPNQDARLDLENRIELYSNNREEDMMFGRASTIAAAHDMTRRLAGKL